MNKVILSLIVAVCVLGMALIMLNERLGRKTEPTPAATSASEAPTTEAITSLPRPAESILPEVAPQTAVRDEAKLPSLPKEPEPARATPTVRENAAIAPETSKPDAPKPYMPKAEVAKPEVAKAETAKPEAPKAEKPKAEKPKAEAAKTQAPKAEKPKAEKPKARIVERITVFARDKGATVRVAANAPFTYKTMLLNSPERLVIDIEGVWEIKAPGVPKNPLVTNVRIGKMPDKTRVVIDLRAKPAQTRYVLAKDGDSLDVRLEQ